MSSQLQLGNRALRDDDLVTAIQCYLAALEQSPSLSPSIGFNVALAQSRLHQRRAGLARQRVLVCATQLTPDLSRTFALCLQHQHQAETELLCCIEPGYSPAMRDLPQRTHAVQDLVVDAGEVFVERAIKWVAEHPFDLIHLVQPTTPNMVVGLLYRLIWGGRVVVDIDDEDDSRLSDKTLSMSALMRLPSLTSLADRAWERAAIGLATKLDGVTVSGHRSQDFGVETLSGEVADQASHLFCTERYVAGRKRLGFGLEHKPPVLLLHGLPEHPAAVTEVASALVALGRTDVVLVVAGSRIGDSVEVDLKAGFGIECHRPGKLTGDVLNELLAVADVQVLLKVNAVDTEAQDQLAATLQAARCGLPTIALPVPGVLAAQLPVAVVDASVAPFVEALRSALESSAKASRRWVKGLSTSNRKALSTEQADVPASFALPGLRTRMPWAPEALSFLGNLPLPSPLLSLLSILLPSTGRAAPEAQPNLAADCTTQTKLAQQAARDLAVQPEPLFPGKDLPSEAIASATLSLTPVTTHWGAREDLYPTHDFDVVDLMGQNIGLLPAGLHPIAVQASVRVLLALADLHGWAKPSAVGLSSWVQGVSQWRAVADTAAPWPAHSCRRRLDRAGVLLADAWVVNDHTLRLRLESLTKGSLQNSPCALRAFQVQPGHEALRMCAEATLVSEGPVFVDLELVNPYFPVLLVLTNLDSQILETSLLPFPSLCRGGLHHGELEAIGTMPAGMDSLEDVSNSLAAELFGWPGAAQMLAIASIEVDLRGATGAEKLFSPLLKEWLAEVMQLGSLLPLTAAEDNDQSADPASVHDYLTSACLITPRQGASANARRRVLAREHSGPLVLSLAAESIPTLSALTSRRLEIGAKENVWCGAWVISDASSGRPRALVSLPPMDLAQLNLQPRGLALGFPLLHRRVGPLSGRHELTSGRAPFPLAIRLRYPAKDSQTVSLQPLATDRVRPLLRRALSDSEKRLASISLLLHLPAGAAPEQPLLESVARQTLAAAVEVLVALPPERAGERGRLEAILARLFPGRGRVLQVDSNATSRCLNEAARLATGRQLLVAAAGTLMHDLRTLEVLYTMAQTPGVGTAACTLLREVVTKKGRELRFHSGGIFPRQIAFNSRPGLVLEEPYTADALPLATYPVVGNSFRLAMVSAAVWREMGGLDAARFPGHRHDLDFCLRALNAGRTHLCTGVVTASLLSAGQAEEHPDTHALALMPMERWHEVLNQVALMRDFDA